MVMHALVILTLVVTSISKVCGSYTQTAKLLADDGATHDYLGRSVAIDGTTAIVGAPYVGWIE